MRCFVDLEGKIPAQVGDRVALVIPDDPAIVALMQAEAHLRPVMTADGGVAFDGDEIAHGPQSSE